MSRKTATVDLPASLTLERILSAAQAAQFIGVSLPTFKRMRRAGKLPPAIQLSERRIGWRVGGMIEHLKAQPVACEYPIYPTSVGRSPGRRGRRLQQRK
jgi:predicted DNA-binding transcriptional regulator AlpA